MKQIDIEFCIIILNIIYPIFFYILLHYISHIKDISQYNHFDQLIYN
jgi:hypothetical protein